MWRPAIDPGPASRARTLEQLESQLGAGQVVLPRDVLDRIDEIVPPGTTINEADRGWAPPWLADPERRRRRR